ncbi:MAG: hypothetical protein CME01_06065 [Geminicoccus sp.]|nr:hypothetical protein [Geminicoccus sp.]
MVKGLAQRITVRLIGGMVLVLAVVLAGLTLSPVSGAQGPDVAAVESKVSVGLFSGKTVVRVFGSTATPDVPIRLELTGPDREVKFTRDVRRFGIKVAQTIEDAPQVIPAIRAELSSGDIPLRREGDALEDALIREGVVIIRPNAIKMEPSGLFFAEIPLPPSAPVGDYKIEIFQEGALRTVAKIKLAEESFSIQQQGFVALVSRGAKDYALFYGLICVLVAVAAGWITERVFRNRR